MYQIWKIVLSYIVPFKLGQNISTLNNQLLYIELYKGRIRLSTEKAVYSFDDFYDNFRTLFKKIDTQIFQHKHILLLGGGLGSIPFLLEKKYRLSFSATIVEKDLSVIHLFKEYSLNRFKNPINLIHNDAAIFEGSPNTFDFIFIDLFIDDKIPSHFLESNFLVKVQKMLKKEGTIYFNWMNHQEKTEETIFTKKWNNLFSNGNVLQTKYNKIFSSQ